MTPLVLSTSPVVMSPSAFVDALCTTAAIFACLVVFRNLNVMSRLFCGEFTPPFCQFQASKLDHSMALFCAASFPQVIPRSCLAISVCLSFYRRCDVVSCLMHACERYSLQCVLSDQPHGGSWGTDTLLQVGSGKG